MNQADVVRQAHRHAVLAIIFWLLIITCIIGLIFQILLIFDLQKLDEKTYPNRGMLMILAIIGIFYFGLIFDIYIAIKVRPSNINSIGSSVKDACDSLMKKI